MKTTLVQALIAWCFVIANSSEPVTENGAWCWFTEPRAIASNGKTYTGWVSKEGDIVAASIDAVTHAVDTVIMHTRLQADDHANPSFLMWPNGRLFCFYSAHNDSRIRIRIQQTPGDFHSFGPDIGVKTTNWTDYPCPHMLPSEDSAIYVFFRYQGATEWNPHFIKSIDKGTTWSTPRHFFLSHGQRPYAKYVDNGKDEIHAVFTDGHPANAMNNLYYVKYKAGATYKADGTRIKSMDSLPVLKTEAEKIYDAASHGNARAWVWDIALDSAGRPVVAYVNFPSISEHRYRFIRWDGTKWKDQELCNSGKWFVQTPVGQSESEPYYSAGLTLDHANPYKLYLSRQDSLTGVFGIQRWESADQGATWRITPVIAGVDTINVRPVIPRGTGAGLEFLFLKGTYSYYGSGGYSTGIRMAVSVDTTPPSTPTGFVVTVAQNGVVSFKWTPSVDAETGISGYELYRGVQHNALSKVKLVRDAFGAIDTFPKNGDSVFYAIRALNGNGLPSVGLSNISVALIPPYVSATFHSTQSTLQSWNSADIKVYGLCQNGLIDSSNIGVNFISLDTASLVVTPQGKVTAKSVSGTARIVASRGGVWLNDTCRIIVVSTGAPFLRRFDFTCNQTVVDSHWIPDSGSRYTPSKGYGWTNCTFPLDFRCNRGGGNLLGSFVMVWGTICTTAVFHVDVPDGDYLTRIGLGDGGYPNEPQWVMFGVDTVARYKAPGNLGNAYSVCDDTITVSDGKGASFLVRSTSNAKISYLVLLSSQGISMSDVAKDGQTVSLKDYPTSCPEKVALKVLPNPFNPNTRIRLTGIKEKGVVSIYSTTGKLIAKLNLIKGACDWDASVHPSGLYFVQAKVGTQVFRTRAMLTK